ncbi:MAG TPA: hypothetical protein VE591_02930 [Candidatus Acidoferrum sp.]|nr:hypothetical protein [Candidatus Acidoferrum sp.]
MTGRATWLSDTGFLLASILGIIVLSLHVPMMSAIERRKAAAGLQRSGLLERSALWYAAFAGLFGIAWLPTRPPAAIDGIECVYDPEKGYHEEVHLSLFVRGRQVAVPMAIGMNNPQPEPYPNGPGAGGPFADNDDCVYWVHTHDYSGVAHVEPQVPHQTFTLGQFFDLWGQPLSWSRAAAYRGNVRIFRWHIDDPRPHVVELRGDPRRADVGTRTHDETTVEVGPPWAPLPRYVWYPARSSAPSGSRDVRTPPGVRFASDRPVVIAKGLTIGARGAPSPRKLISDNRPRSIAVLLLVIGAICAPLEWFLFSARWRVQWD